jgi:hypothetical protein
MLAPKASVLGEDLLSAAKAYRECLGYDQYDVGMGTDSQNGRHDDSLWVEGPGPDDGLRARFEDDGWETFVAPRDDGQQLFSTYGIPVETVEGLRVGDRLRLWSRYFATVTDTEVLADGGPWSRKSEALVAARLTGENGTPFLLVQPVSADTLTVYRSSESRSSGWVIAQESADRLYRVPRADEC